MTSEKYIVDKEKAVKEAFSRNPVDVAGLLSLEDPKVAFKESLEAFKVRRKLIWDPLLLSLEILNQNKIDVAARLGISKSMLSLPGRELSINQGAIEILCYDILGISSNLFYFGFEQPVILPKRLGYIAKVVDAADDMLKNVSEYDALQEIRQFSKREVSNEILTKRQNELIRWRIQEMADDYGNLYTNFSDKDIRTMVFDTKTLGGYRTTLTKLKAQPERGMYLKMQMFTAMISGQAMDYFTCTDYARICDMSTQEGELVESRAAKRVLSALLTLPEKRQAILYAQLMQKLKNI